MQGADGEICGRVLSGRASLISIGKGVLFCEGIPFAGEIPSWQAVALVIA